MSESGTYKIRPAGRHLRTIGSDLIQNQYAAVIELVKNAFDADSPDVRIHFKGIEDGEGKKYQIIISDSGHGMSRDVIINKWLVPSTDDKLVRKVSPNGRIMQGRKGIGRYAASMLGKDLLLESTTKSGETTAVYIVWENFDKAKYLDDVEVLVESHSSKAVGSGTVLTINIDAESRLHWINKQDLRLKDELKKLVSPLETSGDSDDINNDFSIKLIYEDFLEGQKEEIVEPIKPYPIFKLFDYKISGKISAEGKVSLTYESQKAKNFPAEKIDIDYGIKTGCGNLAFDIRVYDREAESLELLIHRGLTDDVGNYLGKTDARNLLNEYNGIGVYRNGFRIRPLGDSDFDWLKLNVARVQNPSYCIGSNQVIGFVQIESEEVSGLEEKSARDGLKENLAYERLIFLTKEVIGKLEERRFNYRKKTGLSRPALKVERELERLFSFEELKTDIRKKLVKKGLGAGATDEIIQIITQEEELKGKLVEDIRHAVAIYQGQATLGKIINIVLHEGRRPLSYFKNQVPNLLYWIKEITKSDGQEKFKKIHDISEGITSNSEILVALFERLDPLAAGKRGAKKKIHLKKLIQDVFIVFREELEKSGITVDVAGPDDIVIQGWQQDVYAIFANLIDNSVFWIKENKKSEKKISVTISADSGQIDHIDYRDTGTGIDQQFIESEVIFEPGFTTKQGGTGLGLPIAGEAAMRCGWELRAFSSGNGAYFRLLPKTGDKNAAD